ncbi:Similar to predicted protein [Populus trichocarpa]; acc. no. XP_002334673 [Pyronema omphalodes CBS 100304]|uniref:Uncharacterized protein n=1 Tax=Pyronema omphalodes (strain CBS 100304) TaxID=1076935 RepID=U4L4A0_PYROM|nr:Similar to predicted protein [Populus trichocarpa]; acc. no. XP_002334673 [Pyronema omphalodes CBS 100304]
MKNLLEGLGMWRIIEDDEHRPLNPHAEAPEAHIAMRHAMQEAFDEKSRECITILKSACSDSIRPYVSRVGCPIEVWDTLERKLGGTTIYHARLALVIKFTDTKPKDGEPFEDYFAKLIDIRNQLHGTPDVITDAQFKAQIMRSMPAWMSITVQFVYQKEETKNKKSETTVTRHKSFFSTFKPFKEEHCPTLWKLISNHSHLRC